MTRGFGHTKSTMQSGAKSLCAVLVGRGDRAQGLSGQTAAGPFRVLPLLCGVFVSWNHSSKRPWLGMLCSLVEKIPHELWFSMEKCRTGLPLQLSLELPIPVVSETCVARSPPGSIPEREKGKVVALVLPDPQRTSAF